MCPHLIDPSRLRFPGNGPLNTEDNLTKLNLQYPPKKKIMHPKAPKLCTGFAQLCTGFAKLCADYAMFVTATMLLRH